MWTYYPDLLATPVPRYTSYPTAAEFHDAVGEAQQRAALERVGADEPISLYVHIPYCHDICWYCGCNTGRANRAQRLQVYLDRLHAEMATVAHLLGGRGKVARVSFGGGSPNAIRATQFADLVGALRGAFSIDPDSVWSIEIDPRGFEPAFADAISAAGFARASLGVQTFDPAIQAAIGRVQPRDVIDRAVAMLRHAGVASLNMDLMYGLPGQGDAELADSIDQGVACGADRLAVFGYAHVPAMIPRQRRIDASALPDARQRFAMAEMASARLRDLGWTAIGFDHFARPGDPLAVAASAEQVRRNFQGFTDDPCDTMIGLGASAISRFAGALVQNEHNSGRYGMRVAAGELAGARGIATPRAERRRAFLIERMLSNGAADISAIVDQPGVRDRLAPFLDRGLARLADGWLTLRPEAAPYARSIAAIFDPWRQASRRTFSSAV